MRNIAVIVFDLTVEYNVEVVKGISDFFKDKKDVHLIISTVNVPESKLSVFEYQYWNATELLRADDIDGYIVVPNSFISYISFKKLSEALEKITNKPVTTVGFPLEFEKKYYTHNSCAKAYLDIVKHLIEKHNCKKIGFFSSGKIESLEGEERFRAYKDALMANGLEYNPDWVLDGDFTPGTAKEEFLKKIKSPDDIPFEAMLCANDYTCAGVLLAMEQMNGKVPDDLLLFGYDDSTISHVAHPTLSTINQHIPRTGYVAAQMVYDLINGKKIKNISIINSYPVYRQSCGCIDCSTHTTAYIDADDNYHGIDETYREISFTIFTENFTNLTSIHYLLSMMETDSSIAELQSTLTPNLDIAKVDFMAVCFYSEPFDVAFGKEFKTPNSIKLFAYRNKSKGIDRNFFGVGGIEFDPTKKLLPDGIEFYDDGTYFLIPIFHREKQYGYMVCSFFGKNYTLLAVYAKILCNTLIQAYEMAKVRYLKERLEETTQSLTLQSKTDELTKIFNRRGFIEYGQQLIDFTSVTGKDGLVFFCDLDGLKTINDTYGHKIGDLAIKTEAEVLKAAFYDSDLIGRLSGDEFGVVAPGFKIQFVDNLKQRLIKINEEYSRKAGLPFTLSISVGPALFNSECTDLNDLLSKADKKLYEEKKIKHAGIK